MVSVVERLMSNRLMSNNSMVFSRLCPSLPVTLSKRNECARTLNRCKNNIRTLVNFQLSKGHGGDKNLAQTVLSKLPELRTIGARHVSYLEWFRLNWHMLKLPPLFAEIFDIPKCEEDLHQGWIIYLSILLLQVFFLKFFFSCFVFHVKRIDTS